MRFPPPMGFTLPLLVLLLGLTATWMEYDLNLSNDLARHLEEVTAATDATGLRLARLGGSLLQQGEVTLLQADLVASAEHPWLDAVAVVDAQGNILAASPPDLRGQPVARTVLARAAGLITPAGRPVTELADGTTTVLGAYPFPLGQGTGWVLAEFDREAAVASARADAQRQLRWVAGSIGLLCAMLWALLHFGYAARLVRLAANVRAFGEGKESTVPPVRGGDEVAEVSAAFATMADRLQQREAEQLRLERELLDISDRERRRMGRDLHDGLGQRLTATSMAASALAGALAQNAPALADRAQSIGQELRAAIGEARALSHGLAPLGLADDGLMAALADLAGATSRSEQVRCVFECPEPVQIANPETSMHLYRIAQEAVTNALKHAAPHEIRIGLEKKNGAVRLEVDDDGDGFEEAELSSTGIGLRVMRYRARLIGAELAIGSPPAGGTRLSCQVQLPS